MYCSMKTTTTKHTVTPSYCLLQRELNIKKKSRCWSASFDDLFYLVPYSANLQTDLSACLCCSFIFLSGLFLLQKSPAEELGLGLSSSKMWPHIPWPLKSPLQTHLLCVFIAQAFGCRCDQVTVSKQLEVNLMLCFLNNFAFKLFSAMVCHSDEV